MHEAAVRGPVAESRGPPEHRPVPAWQVGELLVDKGQRLPEPATCSDQGPQGVHSSPVSLAGCSGVQDLRTQGEDMLSFCQQGVPVTHKVHVMNKFK
jgi:hypothetical protein